MKSGQQEAIKIGFAYVGVVLGAGFSTGQEILQFFTHFGPWSYPAAILSALVIMFIGRQAAKLGNRIDADSHLDPTYVLFGRKFGKVVDVILIFFLYGVMVIMLAGGGSAFQESFGIPAWLGSLIVMFAVMVTLLMGFDKILTALGSVTPFLIAIVLIIAAVNMFTPSVSFSEIEQYTDLSKTSPGPWWFSAITYSGIVLAMAFSILSIVGAQERHKIARRGGLYGGLILLVLVVLMNGGLLSQIDTTSQAELPTLMLARQIHPILGFALTLVMLLVIYNTAVGMLYPFLSRFWVPYSRRYGVALVVALVAGYILSLVGFVDLVNFFYPILGYLGLLIGLMLTIRWVRNKFTKQKLL